MHVLTRAWQCRILAQCSQRKTMQGLQLMSPQLTVATLDQWEDVDQALLRASLKGAFFSREIRQNNKDLPSLLCRFCGQADSPKGPFRLTSPTNLPSCPLPSRFLCAFQACLCDLHCQDVEFCPPGIMPTHLRVLTDGACQEPQCAVARLSAWRVTVASDQLDFFWPICHGVLPGWNQSILRAEIWAVIQALQFTVRSDRTCALWISNELVFRRVQQFRSRDCWVKPNQKDVDLWLTLYRSIRCLGSSLVDVVKESQPHLRRVYRNRSMGLSGQSDSR